MERDANTGVLEIFRLESAALWERLPNKGLLFGLLTLWLALFHFFGHSTLGYGATPSMFNWLYRAYSAGGRDLTGTEDSFRFLVAPVVLFLLYLRRDQIMKVSFRPYWPALGLVLFGSFLHVVGFVAQQPRISIVGMVLGFWGLTGMIWGLAWMRVSFLPFTVFALLVPLGSLWDPLTFQLRLFVAVLAEKVCTFFLAIDIIRQGTTLLDPTGRYHYEVAAACSGLRSLGVTIAFGIVLAFASLKGFWRRVLMIASAFPLAVLGNLLRLLTIIVAAEVWSQAAGDKVHKDPIISLLPYIPAFFGLLMMERVLMRPGKAGKSASNKAPGNNGGNPPPSA